MITGIPTAQIVATAARREKSYTIDLFNVDSNSDIYTIKIFLRLGESDYKVRLNVVSNILSYPALEFIWSFETSYQAASRVYNEICDVADDVADDYNRSMMPAPTMIATLREAIKPVAPKNQEKTFILSLDEAVRLIGVSDWRKSIYQDRYPNMHPSEKSKIHKLENNHVETAPKFKTYPLRGYTKK